MPTGLATGHIQKIRTQVPASCRPTTTPTGNAMSRPSFRRRPILTSTVPWPASRSGRHPDITPAGAP